MPAHERRRILAQSPNERRYGPLQLQVSCGHAAVAQEARPSRPCEGGPGEALLEFLGGAYLQDLLYLEVGSMPGFGRELGPAAFRRLRLVVRADFLANVATEGPIADLLAQFARYLAPVLDGEVGDAQPGVHDAGGLYGPGRAAVHAAGTSSAGARAGRVGYEVEVHDQVSNKEVRADPAVYEARVTPEEPEPRVLGCGALQERHGVREAARLDPDPQLFLQLLPQPEQPRFYDLMVVPPPRVPRHPSRALVIGMIPRIVRDPQRDYAPRALLQFLRVRQQLHRPVHVAHVGGPPRLLPLPQTLPALAQGLCAGHTDEIEASLQRPLLEHTPRLS